MSTDRATYMQTYRAEQRKAGVRRVSATMTEEEYTRLAESAAQHQESATTHLKHLAFAQLDRRYLVPLDQAERLDAFIAIVRGIGNNLNQLARYSNEMRHFLETEEVRLQVKHLEEEVRRFVVQPKEAG